MTAEASRSTSSSRLPNSPRFLTGSQPRPIRTRVSDDPSCFCRDTPWPFWSETDMNRFSLVLRSIGGVAIESVRQPDKMGNEVERGAPLSPLTDRLHLPGAAVAVHLSHDHGGVRLTAGQGIACQLTPGRLVNQAAERVLDLLEGLSFLGRDGEEDGGHVGRHATQLHHD